MESLDALVMYLETFFMVVGITEIVFLVVIIIYLLYEPIVKLWQKLFW